MVGSGPLGVPVARVTADAAVQPRAASLDQSHADEMAEWLRDHPRMDLPPVDIFKTPDGLLLLAHGFHRLEAYRRAGRVRVPAVVREGDRRDAVLHACTANQGQHSLRRTNADKRRAVAMTLAHAPDWSDRRVAQHVGVHHDLVARIRKSVSSEDGAVPADAEPAAKQVGVDGKYRPASQPTQRTLDVVLDEGDDGGGGDGPETGSDAGGPDSAGESETVGVGPSSDAASSDDAADQSGDGGGDESHPADAVVSAINALCVRIDGVKAEMLRVADGPHGWHIHAGSVAHALESARQALWRSRPTEPCSWTPECGQGYSASARCQACRGTGRTTAARAEKGRGSR